MSYREVFAHQTSDDPIQNGIGTEEWTHSSKILSYKLETLRI